MSFLRQGQVRKFCSVGDDTGAVVLSEVPPNATAVGVPARVVKVNGVRSETLDPYVPL